MLFLMALSLSLSFSSVERDHHGLMMEVDLGVELQ